MIVASLVRSNNSGSIGFLGEPGRINVLLSRARHGLILVGNSHTLRAASNPAGRRNWGIVLDQLEADGSMRSGLPAKCQLHGHVHTPDLNSPAAFLERAPDGGCTMRCDQKLVCGHLCTLRCHAFDREHKTIVCRERVHSYCSVGHLVNKKCGDISPTCPTCSQVGCAFLHLLIRQGDWLSVFVLEIFPSRTARELLTCC